MAGLHRARIAVGLAAAVVGMLVCQASAAEPEKARPSELAAKAVREAQQREIYGLADEREALLTAAAALAPDYAPLRWQQGHIRGLRGWMPAEEMLQTPRLAERLA